MSRARLSGPDAVRRLLAPRGIAVVGVSARRDNFGRRFFDNALMGGAGVPVVAVNPRHAPEPLLGAPCVGDVSELPPEIDVAIFVQPAEHVPAALEACAERGIDVVQIISAGLHTLPPGIRERGPRVLGPNSYGCLKPAAGLTTYGSSAIREAMPRAGGIAMVAHSGAVSGSFVDICAHRGLGMRAVVTTGDELDVDALDAVEALAGDEGTSVITWYLEGLPERARMERVAGLLADAGKRLVVLPVGRTQAGRAAALSHTGHVASEPRALSAYLESLGVLEAESLHGLAAMAAALDQLPATADPLRVSVITTTGGVVALTMDTLGELGCVAPPLDAATVEALRPVLGEHVEPVNPVDVGPGLLRSGVDAIGQTARIVSEGMDDGVLLFTTSTVAWAREGIEAFWNGRAPGTPAAVLWLTGGSFVGDSLHRLGEAGIPVYLSPQECAAGLKALRDARRLTVRPAPAMSRAAAPAPPARPTGTPPGERELKAMLARRGVAVPWACELRDGQALPGDIAPERDYVVKARTDAVLSREGAGLVALGCRGPDGVRAGAARVREAAGRLGVELDAVLVEEQIAARAEIFVGVRRDHALGLVAAVGVGGALLETLGHVAVRPEPFDEACLSDLLERGTVAEWLERLNLSGALPAVRHAVAAICELARALGEDIDALDVNPLAVTGDGRVVVLDAAVQAAGP